jgi:hypothetical protein
MSARRHNGALRSARTTEEKQRHEKALTAIGAIKAAKSANFRSVSLIRPRPGRTQR